VRIAVDVMGGDKAPAAILRGCWDAAPLLGPEDKVLLVGDEQVIRKGLEASGLDAAAKGRYQVIPSTEVIAMDESPVEAVRSKPNSSISIMCKLASKGEADAVVSAGNTGACVAAAQLRMRTLPGVSRPGIAIILPTFYGLGANPEPKAKHIEQYAIMAGAYARAVAGIENPRVGLLSIGEEDAKGNTLVREARELMRDEPLINFIGNVEGRDLFKGVVDVVVCDGFVGNIVLKFTEGMFEGLFQTLVSEIQEADPELLAQVQPVLQKLHMKHDWQEHGGAPLLGVNGYCFICHGRSDGKAIMNAIRMAKKLGMSGVNEQIIEQVEKSIPVSED
jgi:phosphate acyltransferase